MNLKNSLWIKTMCFILAPILVFTFVCSIVYMVYTFEDPDYKSIVENDNYFESAMFSDNYKNNLEDIAINIDSDLDYIEKNCTKINDINYILYGHYDTNFNYLIIDKNTNKVYTNLTPTAKTDTVDKIKSEISNNKYYWNNIKGIDTNIDNLSLDNISYTDYLYIAISSGDYEIYSSVSENLKYNDNFAFGKILFTIINKIGNLPLFLIVPLSLILIIIICAYLILSLGHKKDYEGIYLNYLDKLPLEVLLLILIIAGSLFGLVGIAGTSFIDNILVVIGILLFCIDFYICFAILVSTIIKRIKAGTLFKNTLTYKFLRWVKKTFKNFGAWINRTSRLMFSNTNITLKLAIMYFGFILGSILLILISGSSPLILVVIALWIYGFVLLVRKVHSLYKIKDSIHQIYEGNNNAKLDETEFSGDLIEMASDVNDIAGGFSNAIAESLKSERLKTELITNVSHDIKTPLTSIISYVDLLKQEDIKNEKASEYINVLDNKSQRLKKLIEDLVEASKASSGNIKLNKENLNVAELINQCRGEFEDRFKNSDLDIITDIPKEDICIYADSRYMFRVIENIFSNVSKYALKGSRVYIDVTKSSDKINISIKNISKDKLNIAPDELMQRFVRGDKSRFTEGSGLGLSISKSLTELQGGTFEISIDGDLFKVDLSFDMIK